MYLFIVGTIVRLSAKYNDYGSFGDDGFVPRLSSAILQNIIGSNYNRVYLENLIRAGVIVRGRSYLNGEACKEVALTPAYRSAPLVEVEISDVALINKYRVHLKEHSKKVERNLRQYPALTKWMNPKHLRFDEQAARSWIKEHQEVLNDKIWSAPCKRSLKKELSRNVDTTAANYLDLVGMMNQGDYGNPHFDGFGFRFHTPLTNMKSELRHFLTYKWEQLVSVDIKNSQPYFLLPVLERMRSHRMGGEEFLEFIRWMQTGPQSGKEVEREGEEEKTPSYRESVMLNNSSEDRADTTFHDAEVNQGSTFRQLVLDGRLYEELERLFKGRFIINYVDRFADRPRVKFSTLWLMYHDPQARKRHQARSLYYEPVKAFQQRFPGEFAAMEQMKEGDHRDLPRCLQRIESFVMLHQAARRIGKEYPHVPVFPIHDCLVTTGRSQDLVAEIITDECEKVVGAPPKLDKKLLTPEDAYKTVGKLQLTEPSAVVADLLEKRNRNRRNTRKRMQREQR